MSTDGLITLSEPQGAVAEAYRGLRANLEFAALESPRRVLLVTSPGPQEGKSTVLANLAVSLAQAERRVILVDADLRRPALHQIFALKQSPGLSTMLLDRKALAQPPLQDSPLPDLKVLTSGPPPPVPGDALSSPRMEEILGALSERVDFLLLDAPPLLAVSDAAVLATRCQGVLLVLRAGHTRREHAQRARRVLEQAGARLVGVVLNGARLERGLQYSGHLAS